MMMPQICLCLSQEFYSRVAKSCPKFLSILEHISSFTFLIEWFYQEMHRVAGMSKMNEISVTRSCITELAVMPERGKSVKQLNKGLVSGPIF